MIHFCCFCIYQTQNDTNLMYFGITEITTGMIHVEITVNKQRILKLILYWYYYCWYEHCTINKLVVILYHGIYNIDICLGHKAEVIHHHVEITVKHLISAVPNPKSSMFLVSPCSRLCRVHWSQVLSREWRCSWSSASRRCLNYVWMINSFNAY